MSRELFLKAFRPMIKDGSDDCRIGSKYLNKDGISAFCEAVQEENNTSSLEKVQRRKGQK